LKVETIEIDQSQASNTTPSYHRWCMNKWLMILWRIACQMVRSSIPIFRLGLV